MSNQIMSAYNLDQGSQEEIARFTNYLRRRGRISSLLPYNLLILAEDPEELESFVESFSRYTFEQGNARKHRVCICTEDELFRHKATLPQWLRNTHACFIMADGKHPASEWILLEKNLTALPGIVFALCATNKDADERFKETEQIYNQTFSYHIQIGISTPESIHLRLLAELSAQGYGQTDEFKEKLGAYIKAIYPTSSVKNEAFIKELIRRLINNHISADQDLATIEAGAVPPLPGEVREAGEPVILGDYPEDEPEEGAALPNRAAPQAEAELADALRELKLRGRSDLIASSFTDRPCEEAEGCLKALGLISDGILLAHAGRFAKGLNLLRELPKEFPEEADPRLPLIYGAAQEAFGSLLAPGAALESLIDWACQKGYLPLALALIDSRMPEEMRRIGLFSYADDLLGAYADAHRGSLGKDYYIYSHSFPHSLKKILLVAKEQEYVSRLFSLLRTRTIEKAWEGRRLSKEAVSFGTVLRFRDLEDNRTFPLTLSGAAASRAFAFFLLHAVICQMRDVSSLGFSEAEDVSYEEARAAVATYLSWLRELRSLSFQA